MSPSRFALLALLVASSSCSSTTTNPLELTAEDLDQCMRDWPRVGRYHVTNVLGDVEASVAVAESPTGGTFPPGSLLQLFPGEAMLKREAGFDAMTNDWEFFALDVQVDGVTITARGAADTVNMFGGNCFGCHSGAAPEWDFVCGLDHGCAELGVDEGLILTLQRGDLRCR